MLVEKLNPQLLPPFLSTSKNVFFCVSLNFHYFSYIHTCKGYLGWGECFVIKVFILNVIWECVFRLKSEFEWVEKKKMKGKHILEELKSSM